MAEPLARSRTCIVSILVRLTAAHSYDAERLDDVVDYLLSQQLEDGGWNCAARGDRGKHSSFHTSVLALEALDAYQRAGGGAATDQAQARGREFFLRHQLYKSHRTGQVAIRGSTRFPQLPQWHFDILRGLEHFADAALTRTNGWATRSPSFGVPVERTGGGRRTPGIRAAPGFGWRSRVRAGGTPCEAACPGLVGRGRLSNWPRPATLGSVRDVVILGSTGSIGTQSLEVVADHTDQFRVVGLAAEARRSRCWLNKRSIPERMWWRSVDRQPSRTCNLRFTP